MLKSTLILAVFITLQTNGTLLAEEAGWKVTYDQASCLLDNADSFLDSEVDPLIIVIAACPIVDLAEALEQFPVNSTFPSITEIPEQKMDPVIIYTRAELACLVSIGIGNKSDPMELPREPCQ